MLYNRARPGYPDALVDHILELSDLPSPKVIEVGAIESSGLFGGVIERSSGR